MLRRWWLLFGGGSRRRSGSGCALLCSLAVVGASGAALWLELPAVWRWFAQSTVDLLLLCVSVVGDMPAVDGEAGITKSKAKCALSFFPRAPLRHSKKAILALVVAAVACPLPSASPAWDRAWAAAAGPLPSSVSVTRSLCSVGCGVSAASARAWAVKLHRLHRLRWLR